MLCGSQRLGRTNLCSRQKAFFPHFLQFWPTTTFHFHSPLPSLTRIHSKNFFVIEVHHETPNKSQSRFADRDRCLTRSRCIPLATEDAFFHIGTSHKTDAD